MSRDDGEQMSRAGESLTRGSDSAGSRGAGSGGRSPWVTMSIGEIISIVDSMDEGKAAGDAEAIRAAVDAVEGVTKSLESAFGSGSISGLAVDGAHESSTATGGEISAAATMASQAHAAMTAAAAVLAGVKNDRLFLAMAQESIKHFPENAPAVRASVDSLMSSRYTEPMNSAQGSVPSGWATNEAGTMTGAALQPNPGSSGSGDSAGKLGGSTSSTTSPGTNTAGITSVPGTTTTNTSTSPKTTPITTPTSTKTTATTDTPLNLGNDSSPTSKPTATGADDPDGLKRGGQATPVAATDPTRTRTPGSSPATRPGGDPGKPGGLRGGGPGGPGMAGTPLSRRLGVSVPSAVTPVGSTPSTSLPGRGGPGSGPMGGGPHGARGRDNDGKHKTPSYLHTKENGKEIVGTLPLVGPPVIGDWAPPLPADDTAGEPKRKPEHP